MSPQRVAQTVALGLVAAAVLAVLFAPGYESLATTADSLGNVSTGSTHSKTVLDVAGPAVLGVMAVPLVLAALPVLTRAQTPRRAASAVAAVGLVTFTVFGLASIGMFFLPAAALEVAALFLRTARRRDA